LASKGHEIGGHTRNHLSLPSLSHDEQYAQIRGSYDDLVAQGFTPKTFAYPFGDENTTVHAVVQEAGFIGARGVVKGYSDSNSNRYALNDQHIESDVTLDMVKSYIDTAIQNNKWLILELHHQEDVSTNQYSNTPQLLQGIVDYIREKQIEAVTLKDGLFRIFGN
jgi:peptidoglycan/xylan/chitin deacetylase (PgdA/CDA1 family)